MISYNDHFVGRKKNQTTTWNWNWEWTISWECIRQSAVNEMNVWRMGEEKWRIDYSFIRTAKHSSSSNHSSLKSETNTHTHTVTDGYGLRWWPSIRFGWWIAFRLKLPAGKSDSVPTLHTMRDVELMGLSWSIYWMGSFNHHRCWWISSEESRAAELSREDPQKLVVWSLDSLQKRKYASP